MCQMYQQLILRWSLGMFVLFVLRCETGKVGIVEVSIIIFIIYIHFPFIMGLLALSFCLPSPSSQNAQQKIYSWLHGVVCG